jgi:hypothetical protein
LAAFRKGHLIILVYKDVQAPVARSQRRPPPEHAFCRIAKSVAVQQSGQVFEVQTTSAYGTKADMVITLSDVRFWV